jgi:hypothetical protein
MGRAVKRYNVLLIILLGISAFVNGKGVKKINKEVLVFFKLGRNFQTLPHAVRGCFFPFYSKIRRGLFYINFSPLLKTTRIPFNLDGEQKRLIENTR